MVEDTGRATWQVSYPPPHNLIGGDRCILWLICVRGGVGGIPSMCSWLGEEKEGGRGENIVKRG